MPTTQNGKACIFRKKTRPQFSAVFASSPLPRPQDRIDYHGERHSGNAGDIRHSKSKVSTQLQTKPNSLRHTHLSWKGECASKGRCYIESKEGVGLIPLQLHVETHIQLVVRTRFGFY